MTAGKTQLGPFAVRTEAADVDAFRRAIGDAGNGVPLTFPVRWMSTGAVKAALIALLNDEACILVQEMQSFAYTLPLKARQDYRMQIEAERAEKPARLLVEARISTVDGVFCLSAETILRIVPIEPARAA